ncbi:hypothetical protein [Chitinophaga cymbidii]|uniref:hypothetical protein n=1 Tax=Chitinophaga cymbidii TaxID=1096750 RepID=UPI0011BE7593|nr:hypothetical protein [Chitinophaga cymbidii]
MKWWIFFPMYVLLFIGFAVLRDLWWLEKPYSDHLIPDWIVWGLILGGLFFFLFRPRKKPSS